MIFPSVTATYGGALALIFALLSAHVVMVRVRTEVHHGDGGNLALNRVIRAHGNFAEYVPLSLFLIGLIEAGGGSAILVHWLLLPLLVARLMHPVGMQMPVGSFSQYVWRGVSATATWVILVVAAIVLVIRNWP